MSRQVIHSPIPPSHPVVDVAIGILIEGGENGLRLLITQRPKQAILGGYWELPGGKVEPGETIAACLVREFAEEVGLTIEVSESLPVIEHRYDHGNVRLHPCFCRRVSGAPTNLQVAEHRWATAAELSGYRFPPANAELMVTLARKMNAM